MLRRWGAPLLPAEDLHRPTVVLPIPQLGTPPSMIGEQVVIDSSIAWVLVFVILVLLIVFLVRRI